MPFPFCWVVFLVRQRVRKSHKDMSHSSVTIKRQAWSGGTHKPKKRTMFGWFKVASKLASLK